jgi:hypothetical protein
MNYLYQHSTPQTPLTSLFDHGKAMIDTRRLRQPKLHRRSSLVKYILFLFVFLYFQPSLFSSRYSSSCKISKSVQWKRFETSHDPICERLPNASATYIWRKILGDVPKKQSTSFLKRRIYNNPSRVSFQRLFSKLQSRTEPLDVMVLLSKEDATWSQTLQEVLDTAVSSNVVQIRTSNKGGQDKKIADIIIDARAASEMEKVRSKFDNSLLVVTPEASNYLHLWKQTRIRNILEEGINHCNPPLLVLLANDYDHYDRTILSDSLYTRTVQRLAHWYQLGFIETSKQDGDILAQSIAFAFVEWAIDYCSSPPSPETRLLLPGVQELVDTVLPPPLNLDTTWQGISEQWGEAKEDELRKSKLQCKI